MAAVAPTKQPFFLQLVLVGGFLFVALMLFALARSIYRDSFQVGRYIADSREAVTTEQAATDSQKSELEYARTPEFQEKMAKELLGLKMPGEKVIVLTTEEQKLDDLLIRPQLQKEHAKLTLPQKWLRYLFGI